MAVPDRAEIPEEQKWDLDSIYASPADWAQDRERLEQLLDEIGEYEGRVLASADTLRAVIELREEIARTAKTLAVWARCRAAEDTRDDERQARASQADALLDRVGAAMSFITPALAAADEDAVRALAAEAGLDDYDHYFDDLFRTAEHVLPPDQEELLAAFGSVHSAPGRIHAALLNADLAPFPEVDDPAGGTVEVTHERYRTLLKRQDRDFRETVYDAFRDHVLQYEHALATNYEARLRAEVTEARQRGHDSALAAALTPHNLPTELYHTVLDTVEARLDLLHRALELRADCHGIEPLRPWDTRVPLATTDQPEIPYDEAREHLLAAVAPLGEDYVDQVRAGLDGGWVDLAESRGKRSGAFSWGSYDTHPVVFLNYTEDISSMYTLAHEMGHAMHTKLSNDAQPFRYADYPIFQAEIASTVHEALLTRHLLDTVEDADLRRHLLSHQLDAIEGTLFTQTMFARFELQAHERVAAGEGLPPAALNELYGDLRTRYHAPVDPTEDTPKGWQLIPHLVRSPYYVWQYATGLSTALAIADTIPTGGAEDYLAFLRAGSSDYPLALLDDLGVDLPSGAPVDAALDTYADYLDRIRPLVEGSS